MMKDINSQIANFDLRQLKMALEEQNDELLKEIYLALSKQQRVIQIQQREIEGLQKSMLGFTKLLEKIFSKVENLHQAIEELKELN